jgi:hypothetical protein
MAISSAQARIARLERLKAAVTDYVEKEKERIEREVGLLEAVKSGRSAGEGAGTFPIETVSRAAEKDLYAYLRNS